MVVRSLDGAASRVIGWCRGCIVARIWMRGSLGSCDVHIWPVRLSDGSLTIVRAVNFYIRSLELRVFLYISVGSSDGAEWIV